MQATVTPEAVERRLVALSKEIDECQAELERAELAYHKAKTDFELGMARERLRLIGVTGLRVQDVADRALVACSAEYSEVQLAEAVVKAARGNAQRVRTQVDIARSIGTSVRSALEL